ncbi:MAG: polysaccharide deacetylase family protein [Spirochaetota bacterium]
MRRLIAFIMVLYAAACAWSEVSFSGLDLAASDELVFSATADAPGFGSYRTLFHADLSAVADEAPASGVAGGDVLDRAELRQLTFFPEIMTYLPALQAVQIQNRFGVFRASISGGVFEPVGGFDSFVAGAAVETGRVFPVTASPDGRYLVVVEPTSAAYGELVLLSTDGTGRTTVATDVELSTERAPARWSPDSRFFVYSRRGRVYYYSIEQHERGRLLGASFRELGPGTLESVRWSAAGSLFYVSGSLVYEILGPEFFTRSLYAGLLPIGTIVGKLPFPFDPNFDSFTIGPGRDTALLNKGGRNLFVLVLDPDDFATDDRIVGLPSLFLPRNTRVRQIVWSALGDVTILTGSIEGGENRTSIFRLDADRIAEDLAFERVSDAGVTEITLSPNEERVALLTGDSVVVRDHATWTAERTVPIDRPLHAVWLDAQRLLVGGESTIDVVDASSGASDVLALSQSAEHSIGERGTIIAGVAGRSYAYGTPVAGRWNPTDSQPAVAKQIAGPRFRVFLESLSSGSYRNIVMVRRVRGVGTSLLFPPPEQQYEPFPESEDPVNLAHFEHGSRIRRREVSLVFNAIDSVEGLTEILNTLAGYDVRTTFFVNGEFIRRHPDALSEIAAAGHEVGSLFFAHFDMSDRRYRITPEFIREGLSRNEDEYFTATGRELSLLWHAPYYFGNDEIVEAGRDANYVYVGRDVDSLDWVPMRTDEGLSRLSMPASRLVERILELKQPGSIVSMHVGISEEARGGRDDYLFQRLDILIDGLIAQGYEVVPVSTLIEHAQ